MITIPTAAVLRAQVLAYFTTAFPGRDVGTASYFGQWAGVLTEALLGIYQQIRDAETGAIPSDSTPSARLDEYAVLFGLSDGDGGYGRKGATAASGGVAPVTYSGAGPFPYTLSAGQVLVAPDGVTLFATTANVVWNSAGSQNASIDATTTGTAGNLSIGTVLSLVSPPASVSNSVTLSTATSGAEDSESDSALLARILDRLQNPPKGGTAADYKAWAESQSGVTTAYVYPRRQGTGSVDVVITQAGTGKARGYNGSTTTRDAVDTYIETVRPVTVESANTMIPTMSSSEACVVLCRIVAAPGVTWDWDDTAAAYPTVKAGGTTTLLRINGSPPTALAVGDRIQIANTNASAPVLPEMRTVSAIDTATINPDTILTLSTALTAYPTAGDTIYAGGDAVTVAAQAVLDLVDSLGPSKSSGYADDSDSWDDTLRVDQIIRAVLAATDDGGNSVARDFVTDPTIGVGGGALAATNVTPADAIATTPPSMLWLQRINVTQ